MTYAYRATYAVTIRSIACLSPETECGHGPVQQVGVTVNRFRIFTMQPGDAPESFPDIKKLSYKPRTSIKNGIPKFINWYKKDSG